LVLRKLDPWSVLKLSLVFYLALFVVILVAGVLLWAGRRAVGVVGNIEHFMVGHRVQRLQVRSRQAASAAWPSAGSCSSSPARSPTCC